MATDCTNCGHPVPEGQFRCGRCGAPQERDELDDDLLDGEAQSAPPEEVPSDPEPAEPPEPPGPPEPALTEALQEQIADLTPGADASERDESDDEEDDNALSLPPTPIEPEVLELTQAQRAKSTGPAPEPEPDGKGERASSAPPVEPPRDDETERRPKTVPKGAFGEGSVVDKLPQQEPEADLKTGALAPAAVPKGEGATKDDVQRLPGLEPTRLGGESEDEAPAKGEEAGRKASTQPAATQAEDDEDEDDGEPLELDVPSGGLRNMPNRPSPPFLASEIMREEVVPEHPATHRIAQLAQLSGVISVISYGALAFWRPEASAWGLPGLVMLALGVARLSYLQRAASISALTLTTLTLAAWLGAVPHPSPMAAALPFVVMWLGTALLLRAWYRAHRQPPWLVALGVVAAASLGITAMGEGAWVLHAYWQSWLPAALGFVFVLLCLLSLLAFMGPDTSAGGTLWAALWVGWYIVAHVTLTAVQAAPVGGTLTLDELAVGITHSALITVFMLPAGSLALAQLYAMTLRRYAPAADEAHIEAAIAD